MKLKKIIAVSAAVLTMASVPMNAYAASITEKGGIRYQISDNGKKSLYTGWTKKGSSYYYYKDGVMQKNCWIPSESSKKYFLQADGTRATGKVMIRGVEYEFDKNGVLISDAWGLTFTVKNVTPTGCEAVFTRSGGDSAGELGSGSSYTLEQYSGGKWTKMKMLMPEHEVVWPAGSSSIKNNSSAAFDHNWKQLYGELSEGSYRIGKEVSLLSSPGGSTKKTYYAYFEIGGKTAEKESVSQAGAVAAYDKLCSAFDKRADGSAIYPKYYAGAWIGDDNMLHIALTKTDNKTKDSFRKMTGNSKCITFEKRKYSLNELEKIRKKLNSLWSSKYHITAHYIDPIENACVFEFAEKDLSPIEKDLRSKSTTIKLNNTISNFDKKAVVIKKGSYASAE